MIVRRDDADRKCTADRILHIGTLDRGLDVGPKRAWTIVSMKDDRKTAFPWQLARRMR
jgi:hypothetical protein